VGGAARAAALTGPGALDGVHPIEGNEVVEIAVVAATKGKALTKLRADVEGRRGAPVTVLYAGDVVTDETALATLKFSDVGIKVGHSTTVARFWVTDPPAMPAALRVYVHQRRRRANRAETATGEGAGDRSCPGAGCHIFWGRRVPARTAGRVRKIWHLHNGSSGTYLPVKGKTVASVTYETASRIYPGTERPAVDSLDLEIEDGEFLVLVGPSGCGKSTSLRMLAGLEDVNTGRILI